MQVIDLLEIGFDREPGHHGVAVDIGLDQGPIRVERLADDQARRLTAGHDRFEELKNLLSTSPA